MKQLLLIIITLLILSACGQAQEGVTQEMPNTADTNIEESFLEDPIAEDANIEIAEESELELVQGFTPFEELNDFVIDEKAFESIYFEISNGEESDPTTWSTGNISHIIRAEDGTLYYFSDSSGTGETGLIYDVFTFDENNNAIVESKIYSPTKSRLLEEDEYFDVYKQIIDNTLVMRYEHNEDYDSKTKQVTVETLDISDIFTGDTREYESEVVANINIGFIEDERYDFGDIVSTSKGPVFVYQEKPENRNEFQINPLNNNELDEELILNDPYDLAYGSGDIKFIDFEQGYYFVYDSSDDGLKRLEVESGEPLYDGSNDKILSLDSDAFDRVIHINDTSFYAIDDNSYTIYIINTDLDLIDSTSLFASEYEADDYDGNVTGPYYLGNNEFIIMDEYEYQRKERLKFSIGEYVF